MQMKKPLMMVAAVMMAALSTMAQSGVFVRTEAELNDAIATYPKGTAILSANITLSNYVGIPAGSNVTLDLNGHTLRRNLNATDRNGHVIEIFGGGTLILQDNAGGGTISGGRAVNGGGICNYGTLFFLGGTITNCNASEQGGGIKNNSGCNVLVAGGVIHACWSPQGGGICNNGGTVIISGSTISGCTADNITLSGANGGGRGGAIWNNATLSMGEATITDNRAHYEGGGIFSCAGTTKLSSGTTITNNVALDGGGIYVDDSATAEITGVTITGNKSEEYGGGGITNEGTLTVNGGTSITGNQCVTFGAGIWTIGTLKMQGTVIVEDNARVGGLTSNVFLKHGCVITVVGDLGSSQIGLTMDDNNGIATSGFSGYGTLGNFTNDFPQLASFGMSDNQEIQLSKKTDIIYYVERSWDATTQKVVETIKTVLTSECTFLDGTSTNVAFNSESSKPFLVVRGNNAYYDICVSNNRSLIICDGARLNCKYTLINVKEGNQLNIYGQMDDSGELMNGPIIVPESSTLNIYGGSINTYGRGYACAGIGGAWGKSAGNITIYGGDITAKGGFGIDQSSGAGIGGGGSGSGGTITIYGGTIKAVGGNDAAGIGSGEEGIFSHCNGGNITIAGGTVYAYGNDEGAGIGAGQDADAGIIKILGGYVYAEGGENSMAICGHDDTENENICELGDNMMVTSECDFTYPERINAIKGRRSVTIKPCPHSGATYTVSDATVSGTHTMHCSYCKYSFTERHTFVDGICSVCHVSGSVSTISIYLPEKVGDSYADGHYADTPKTQTLVTGSSFELPAPPVSYLPSGVIFAGWLVGTPTELGITSYWMGENEPVFEAGSSHTIKGDVSLTARYRGIDIDLVNDASNYETLNRYNGKTAQTVTLTGRTLYKDGSWNTLCLPFALSNLSGTPLAGATVKTMESATFADGTVTINFSSAGLTAIEAGKPYIVKWARPDNYVAYDGTNANATSDIVNPVFIGVIISSAIPKNVSGDAASFRGIFSPYSTGGEDRTMLFLGADDNLYWPNSAMTIGAFRAYFTLHGITAGDLNNEAPIFVLNFGSDEASGITTVNSTDAAGTWYDMQGRRLNGKPTQYGIYINNGKKVVVK